MRIITFVSFMLFLGICVQPSMSMEPISPIRSNSIEEDLNALSSQPISITQAIRGSLTNLLESSLQGFTFKLTEGHKIEQIAVSPDGQQLAIKSIEHKGIGGRNNMITLLNIQNLKFNKDKTSAYDPVTWHIDRKKLSLLAGGKKLFYDERDSFIRMLAWNPDKEKLQLAAGGDAGLVKIWNTQTGEVFKTLSSEGLAQDIAWSLDGKKLAVAAGSKAKLWDVETDEVKVLIPSNESARNVGWSPDGKQLVTAGFGIVTLWDAETGEVFKKFLYKDWVSAIQWSPDGKQLAIEDLGGKKITILDVHDGKMLDLPLSGKYAWNPNARKSQFAITGDNSTIKIWDTQKGELFKYISVRYGSADPIRDIAWNPDGEKLAIARSWYSREKPSNDLGIMILDPQAVTISESFNYYRASNLAWDPNEKYLAFRYNDNQLVLKPLIFNQFRPIDYLVLHFLKEQYELGNPIEAAQFPELQRIINTADQPMQKMMKKFVLIPLPKGFDVDAKDYFFSASFKVLIDEQFKKNKAFILAAVLANEKYNFYEADGLNIRLFYPKLYADQLVNKPWRNRIDPTKVLYFIATKEKQKFTYIGSLADLMEYDEQGKEMRKLFDANYGSK